MNVDRAIRFVTALAVLTVAVIAAIVSYNHIEYLALSNGQTITASRLLPISVDGTVVVSSMVLLDAARRGVHAPALARVMLAAGVIATLLANALVGAAHGVIGITISGWPAVAFIGSAGVLLAMIRQRSQTVPEVAHESAPEVNPQPALVASPARTRQADSGTRRALPTVPRAGVGYMHPKRSFRPRSRPESLLLLGRSSAGAASGRYGLGKSETSWPRSCPHPLRA